MHARAVDDAARELHDLRLEKRGELGLATTTFVAAFAATRVAPSLAVPLLVGAAAIGARALYACWRHWDLLERLTHDRDAYAIDEVRAEAVRAGSIENRRELARMIRVLIQDSGDPAANRLASCAGQLYELARELEDDDLELDLLCAVECNRLLTDRPASLLFDQTQPLQFVRASLSRIQSGFARP